MKTLAPIEPRQLGGRVPLAVLQARGAIEDMRSQLNNPCVMLPPHVPEAERLAAAETVRELCAGYAQQIPADYADADIADALAAAKTAYLSATAEVRMIVATDRHRSTPCCATARTS